MRTPALVECDMGTTDQGFLQQLQVAQGAPYGFLNSTVFSTPWEKAKCDGPRLQGLPSISLYLV